MVAPNPAVDFVPLQWLFEISCFPQPFLEVGLTVLGSCFLYHSALLLHNMNRSRMLTPRQSATDSPGYLQAGGHPFPPPPSPPPVLPFALPAGHLPSALAHSSTVFASPPLFPSNCPGAFTTMQETTPKQPSPCPTGDSKLPAITCSQR